jgi:alcohol dehydrogenase class IV
MIYSFAFHVPVRIIFGPGKLTETGSHAKDLGSKALIVTTGTFFKESGVVDRLQHALSASGVTGEEFSHISPNPLSTEIDAGAKFALSKACDVFIGLGGGSAMDAAKMIAYAVSQKEPIWPSWIGEKPLVNAPLPVIAITTTSGTASHVSPWAVVTNPQTMEKPGNGNDGLFPRVSIVDPELMLSLPKSVTATTTFDVLAHALEGYTSTLANPITDMYCERAMRLVGKWGRVVAKDGSNLEARAQMALADTLVGYSLSVAIVTLAHAIAHCIGGTSGTSHGGALSALTPYAMRFSMNSLPSRFADIGVFLKDEPAGRSGWTPEDSVREVEKFIRDIGAPSSLREQGVQQMDFARIADDTLRVTAGSVGNDARKASREDIMGILRNAF